MINGYLNFFGDSIEKQWTISCTGATFRNEDIIDLMFNESICSESQLAFGASESNYITLRTTGLGGSLVGQWLNVTCKVNDTTYQIGRYKVLTDVPNGQRTERTITAYDALYDIINADVAEWYNTLLPNDDSTTTVAALRHSFMQHFNITENAASLVNDSLTVKKSLQTNQLSGRDVVRDICELNGCFGHIDRDGHFKYVFLPKKQTPLYPRTDLYPAADLYPNGGFNNFIDIEKDYVFSGGTDSTFMCEPITKLIIRSNTDDVGVTVGSGDNTFIVEGNILAMGQEASTLETIGTNILGVISDVTYRPCNYDIVGNPLLEVGDGVNIRTDKTTVYTYILQRVLKGVQSLTDTITASGLEKQVEKVNNVESQIIQLKGKTNELVRTLDETRSTITDLDEQLQSEIDQQADLISAKVAKTGGGSSFSWELTDSSWVVKSGSTTLFSVDTNGVGINMKNQNVSIDDTGINFSTNASLKLSSIVCFFLGAGQVNVGNPSFNFNIRGNQVAFGTTQNYLGSIDVNLVSGGAMRFHFGSGLSTPWKIDSTNLGPIYIRSSGYGISGPVVIAGNVGFHSHAPASQPTISNSLSDTNKISSILNALNDCGLIKLT